MTGAIVDMHGRPLAGARTAHTAASFEDDELRTWQPPHQSADADVLPEWDTMASRSLDMVRNHGLTAGGVQTHLDNIIGPELKLSAKPDWRRLGLDAGWAREWERHVESAFRLWAEDIDRYCDAARKNTFTEMIQQGYRSFLTTGEILATAEWLPGRGSRFSTAIQMIEPERLSNPHHAADTERLRAGVEVDHYGAAWRYWIASGWENEPFMAQQQVSWRGVPTRTQWGRTQVIHVFEVERPGQTRGKGGLVPVLAKLKMLDQFEKVTLQAAILNAMYAAVIESAMDWNAVGEAIGAGTEADSPIMQYMADRNDWHKKGHVRFNGVKIPHLYPGEKLEFTNPKHPSAQFQQFEEATLRHVAGGFNLSYEQLARDYSKSNYSSARAAMLEAWKFFKTRRTRIAGRIATQVYALWLEEAIDLGEVEIPPGAPSFYEEKTAWTRCKWIGPGRGHIDPLKEANATKVEYSMGLTTLEKEAAERGEDWEELMEQRAQELARMQELGIDPASMMAPTPVPQPPDPPEANT